MNESTHIEEILPLYVSGALDAPTRASVARHLAECAACREELALWQAIAGPVMAEAESAAASAPRDLAERALTQIHAAQSSRMPLPGLAHRLAFLAQLLRAQAPLVQREIWPASAAVIAVGVAAALISAQAGFVYALAPLIAAACMSLLYGPENDPALELSLSTPTSPRQVLLARLALVFGYNLALVGAATLALLPMLPDTALLDPLVLRWLAPMTFLSAAALLLSLWTGAPNAISATYLAWLLYLLAGPLHEMGAAGNVLPTLFADFFTLYSGFWQNPALLLSIAAVLTVLAFWQVGRSPGRMTLRL
jgi:hypothetical protein